MKSISEESKEWKEIYKEKLIQSNNLLSKYISNEEERKNVNRTLKFKTNRTINVLRNKCKQNSEILNQKYDLGKVMQSFEIIVH